jgi:hypothetical protein
MRTSGSEHVVCSKLEAADVLGATELMRILEAGAQTCSEVKEA